MLLVAERQACVAWKPANKAALFQRSASTGWTSDLTVLAVHMLLKGTATSQFDQEICVIFLIS